MAGWTAAELEWGHGPRVFEMFLEPTCPFSNKAFGKIKDLLAAAVDLVVALILVVVEGSVVPDAIVMEAVAAHRDEFEFDKHCTGPNRTATPNDIIARIERYSGVKLAAAFDIPDLDKAIKLHCRYARQNGIHVSPTFMINGLVQSDMSSGDAVAVWAQRLTG